MSYLNTLTAFLPFSNITLSGTSTSRSKPTSGSNLPGSLLNASLNVVANTSWTLGSCGRRLLTIAALTRLPTASSCPTMGTVLGGPAQVFPPIFFFCGGRPTFRSGQNPQKNRQTPNKERPFFRHDENPHPPIVAIFQSISSSAGRSIGKLAIVSARTF